MSGSGGGDDSVRVNINADASGFVDNADKAARAAANLAASLSNVTNVVGSGRSAMVGAGADVTGLAAALLKAGVAASDVAKYLGITTAAASGSARAMADNATAAQAAAAGLQNIGAAAGRTASQIVATAAETKRLDETIARLMGGLSSVAASSASAAKSLQSTGQAATTASSQIDVMAATQARLDQATRQVLSGLSPAATAMLLAGSAAANTTKSLDTAAVSTRRLDEATARVLASLSPAATALLQASVAATQLNAAMSGTASVAAGAADGVALTDRAMRTASVTAREMINTAAQIAATSAPLKTLSEDYAKLAAGMLNAGASAKEVATLIGLPVASVRAFDTALRSAVVGLQQTTVATKQASVVTAEMARVTEAAARMDATCAKALADMAAAQTTAATAANAGSSATTKSADAARALGAASEQAGARIISAGNKAYAAGTDVTYLYTALTKAGYSAQQAANYLGVELPDALDKTSNKARSASTGFSGITREIVVLGHEAMSGRFSMIPGSLLTLVERCNGLIGKITEIAMAMSATAIGIAASVVAIVASIGAITARAIEAANAIRHIGNAAVLLGRDTEQAKIEAGKLVQGLQGIGVGQSEAIKVVAAFAMIGESSAKQRAELADLATAFALSLGITPEKAAEQLARALEKGGGGVRKLVDEYKLWDAQSGLTQRMQLKLAEDTHDSAAAIDLAIGVLAARFPEYAAKIKAFRAEAGDLEFQSGPAGGMELPKAPQRAEDPAIARDRDATAAAAVQTETLAALKLKLASAQATYAAAATEGERAISAEAVNALTVQIRLHREQGDATWMQSQTAALDAIVAKTAQSSTNIKTIAAEENRARIAFWDEALTHANLTDGQRTEAEKNLSIARRNLATEELRIKADGETSWKNLQLTDLAVILGKIEDNATQSKTLAQDENKAKIAFWHQAAQQAGLSQKQITDAEREEAKARHDLKVEELRAKEADEASWHAMHQESLNVTLAQLEASGRSSKQLAMDENRARVSFWTAASKEIGISEKNATAARAEAENANRQLTMETLRSGETAAKQALATKLAALSAEQAAVHDNFTAVMAIEAQKIALLRAAGASATKLLNEELGRQATLEREHTALVAQNDLQQLATTRSITRDAIAEKKAQLNEEFLEGNITKQQELATLREFTSAAHAVDIAALAERISTLGQGTKALESATNEERRLISAATREEMQLRRAAIADLKAQFDTAIGPITGSISNQASAVLRGTETMKQAWGKLAQDVVVDYVQMALKATQHWAAGQLTQLAYTLLTESEKTSASAAGATQREAIATSETVVKSGGIAAALAAAFGFEAGKTAIAGAGAGTRGVISTVEFAGLGKAMTANLLTFQGVEAGKTGSMFAASAAQLGAWTATEAGKTAVTVGGAAAQTGAVGVGAATQLAITKSSAAAGMATDVAMGAARIMNAAKTAAASTYSAVSSIPYVGWILAPAAAAAAFVAVGAFNTLTGLETGAWEVPQNMAANLHAGEMVVPASFAEGIRNAGGSGSSQTLNYAPTLNGGGADPASMRAQAGMIKSYLWHATRNGALRLPGR